jgi:hypothetical protein
MAAYYNGDRRAYITDCDNSYRPASIPAYYNG